MRMPSTRTLVQACLYTSFAGISGLMLLRHKIQQDVRNTEYFRDAMKLLRAHPGSVHYLGQPIKETGFDLGDNEHNFCDGNKAQFEVSIKGPKDKGKMYFWAERAESKEWIVNRLEVELNSVPDKRLIVQTTS
ncbi:hypothetical protein HA402_011856 [Bradysia odoriphaga]|nr:hypothetical protein HA402_011856 [Bradysia odoriphaga]